MSRDAGKLYVRTSKYKALIVGCGRIAGGEEGAGPETHAGAIKLEPRVSLEACVYKNAEKGKIFARKYECLALDSLREGLFSVQPDLVSICTPDSTHFPLTREVLISEIPPRVVFLEKPAGTSKAECEELRILAKKAEVLLVINQTRRFSPKYSFIRDFISKETFGPINRANATYYSGWLHNGTHLVDTLAYLFRDTIRWEKLLNTVPSPYEGDPSFELIGAFETSNAKVVVSAIDEAFYQLFDFDFWFERGRLRIEDFGSRISFEKQVVNQIGEHVLEPCEIELPSSPLTEMQIALGLICDFLDNGDNNSLKPVSIEEIESTMNLLWQALELHFENS
jgi:predicted dehydrogenase